MKYGIKSLIKRNLQLMLTVLAVIIGFVFGFVLRLQRPSDEVIFFIGFPGEILMNMLKMMILPLIVSSLISGLSQLDAKESGRAGKFALIYYIITMLLAVATGVVLVILIHPGNPMIRRKKDAAVREVQNVMTIDKFLDLIRNMLPDNILRATFQSIQSNRTFTVSTRVTENNESVARQHLTVEIKYVDGVNILGIIVFCIVFGIAISHVGDAARPLRQFFIALDIVVSKIVIFIMWYAPVGIASLISERILEVDDLSGTVQMLGIYVLAVMIGLAVHMFITQPLIYFVFLRRNPYKFLSGLLQAALTAFGTASR